MASTPTSKSTAKSTTKPSKKVILRLSPQKLAKFASPPPSKAEASPAPSPAPAATPLINAPPAETSDSNTPAPSVEPTAVDSNSLAPPPAANGKKKGGATGAKTGNKRTAAQAEGGPKPRGKPGPKKKPRLADGTIDHATNGTPTTKKGPFSGVAPISNHKLGPKANTGAINAGLRALDRSGKPCRRWERKGFELKSISGHQWTVGSWSAPPKDDSTFSGDVKSESSVSSEAAKVNMESSAVQSDRSNSGDVTMQNNTMQSSPAPALAAVEA